MTDQPTTHLFFMIAIGKMVEPYGVDYKHVMQNQHIDGVPWYEHYTWTAEQEQEFRTWFIREAKTRLRWAKQKAEREFAYFNMQWGLKIN